MCLFGWLNLEVEFMSDVTVEFNEVFIVEFIDIFPDIIVSFELLLLLLLLILSVKNWFARLLYCWFKDNNDIFDIEGTNSEPTSAPTDVANNWGESSTLLILNGIEFTSWGLDISKLKCVIRVFAFGDFGDFAESEEKDPPLLLLNCGDIENFLCLCWRRVEFKLNERWSGWSNGDKTTVWGDWATDLIDIIVEK